MGLGLLPHGKGQQITEDQKLCKMAFSGSEDLEDSLINKHKYIIRL